jgi:arginase family enzyme
MENYFINVPFDNSSAKHTIYNNFNYEICNTMHSALNEDDVPIVYNFIHKYIKSLKSHIRPIVFSPDYSISASTCTAVAERYLEQIDNNGKVKYVSPLKIIYLTSSAHLKKLTHVSALDFSKSILSNIFDENEISYTHHRFIIPPEQIFLVGLNDNIIDNDDIENIKLKNMKYFTLSTLKKKGIENICDFLINEIGEDPVYVIYDMSVFSFESSPCTYRIINNKEKNPDKLNGLSLNEMIILLEKIKVLNIVGLDITGFNLKKETPDVPFKITSQCANLPLVHLLGIKEKKINLFNQNTKIIICKPIDSKINWEHNQVFENKKVRKQAIERLEKVLNDNDIEYNSDHDENGKDDDEEQEYDDYGWYVMRGIPTALREELTKKLIETEDNIILYELDGEKLYISFTTIEEQESLSYYHATSIKDRILLPGEKVNLMFSQL